MSFGDGDLHVQVAQLKTENARLKQQLDKLPEIVRCRDCKRFHTNTNGFDCPKLEPNGFCAWGERKETSNG